MRIPLLLAVVALSACGPRAAHEYPETARAEFDARCQTGPEACACMWEKITTTVPYPEYEAAMTRFTAEGLMDPRITRARTECLEQAAR